MHVQSNVSKLYRQRDDTLTTKSHVVDFLIFLVIQQTRDELIVSVTAASSELAS